MTSNGLALVSWIGKNNEEIMKYYTIRDIEKKLGKNSIVEVRQLNKWVQIIVDHGTTPITARLTIKIRKF